MLYFGSSLCLAGRNFHRQSIHLERLVAFVVISLPTGHSLGNVGSYSCCCPLTSCFVVLPYTIKSLTRWVVNRSRYVRAWGALVRRANVQRRTKDSVPIFNKPVLSMDRIVEDVLRITYVYVVTVDGRHPVDIARTEW